MIKKGLLIVLLVITVLMLSLYLISKNSKEKSNNYSKLIQGDWIADGSQHRFITGYKDGKPIYSIEGDLQPFYLSFDKDKKYVLKMNNITEKGDYSISNKGEIVLKSSTGFITENCKFKTNDELNCNMYADTFIRN